MKFNEFMKKSRESASLTQETASTAIGVGVSTIQNWERSSSYPERAIIPNIAKAYSISVKRIFDALAADYELSNEDTTFSAPKVIPFTDLLPDNLDYSSILDLEFNEKEQDMFLLFALNVKFGGNPITSILNKYSDTLDLALFIDKLEKYNLFKVTKETLSDRQRYMDGSISSYCTSLTAYGTYIYTLIKSKKYRLFSVYDLDLNDFLSILELYKIISHKDLFIYTLNKLSELDTVPLEEYRANPGHSNYSSYHRSRPKEIKVDLPMYVRVRDIDPSYYSIESEELNDEVYLMEKELYLKKLDFYEQHKELNDGLVAPTPFEFKEIKKAIASEKAKKFIAELNKSKDII